MITFLHKATAVLVFSDIKTGSRAIKFVQTKEQEANKSTWGMPRLSEMTKDAISCEKLRGGANDH